MSIYYVNEINGEWREWKFTGNDPCRTFSDRRQAAEYSNMIKKRIENEENLKKQLKNSQKQESEFNQESGSYIKTGNGKFHFIYCLIIGWWLALMLVCFIFPLFFRSGRSLIKKAFGIW